LDAAGMGCRKTTLERRTRKDWMGKLGKEMARRNIQKASKIAWLSYNRNKEKRGNCAGDFTRLCSLITYLSSTMINGEPFWSDLGDSIKSSLFLKVFIASLKGSISTYAISEIQ
jgi:hypothetical protein